MSTPQPAAYVHGYDGLAGYFGVSVKTARALDARINFPRHVIPGVIRPTVLFRLSEIDTALDLLRQEKAQFTDPVTRPSSKDVRHLNVKTFADAMLNGG